MKTVIHTPLGATVISNVGRTAPPTSNLHVDTSYVREPPAAAK